MDNCPPWFKEISSEDKVFIIPGDDAKTLKCRLCDTLKIAKNQSHLKLHL